MLNTTKKFGKAIALALILSSCEKNEIILNPNGNGTNPTNGGSNGGTNGGSQSAPDTLKKDYSTVSIFVKAGTTVPDSVVYTEAGTGKPYTMKNDPQGGFSMEKSGALLKDPNARGSFSVNAASIALAPENGDFQFISNGRIVKLTVGKNVINPKVSFFNANMAAGNMIEKSAAILESSQKQKYSVGQ